MTGRTPAERRTGAGPRAARTAPRRPDWNFLIAVWQVAAAVGGLAVPLPALFGNHEDPPDARNTRSAHGVRRSHGARGSERSGPR